MYAELFTNGNGGLTVTLHGDPGNAELLLYTCNGRFVTSRDPVKGTMEVTGTRDLPGGVYFVVIRNDQYNWVLKWSKSGN